MALSGKLRRGTRLEWRLSSTAHALQSTPATVEAHGPEGVVKEWKWRPGSPGASSPQFFWTPSLGKLTFKLTSRESLDLAPGSWKFYFLVGTPNVDQDEMLEYTLTVRDGKNAPLSTELP